MEQITIAGKRFKAVAKSTMRHDIATRDILLRMGMSRFAVRDEETEAGFRERLLGGILDSDELFPLLGHLMMPVSKQAWSPRTADDTARFLGNLTDPVDKATLVGVIVELALFFCLSAVGCMLTSRKSFPLAANALDLFRTAELVSSASGVHSSAM